MLRKLYRGDKSVKEIIAQVDAFPKVEEVYVETNSFGGVVSLVCWLGIVLLLYSEITYYLNPELEYKYEVDKVPGRKLTLNVDMTVAMKCNLIGADILDLWGNSLGDTKLLKEELVPFQLADNQKLFLQMQGALSGLNAAPKALHDMVGDISRKLVPRDDKGKEQEKDACRLYGSIPIDKVQGNFHILSGRSVNLPGMGHAHLQFGDIHKNFSHRIDGLTFGDRVSGMLYALDGEEKIAPTSDYSYQYFIQIVPTTFQTDEIDVQTYQYTVEERVRAIDHSVGSTGTPGIVIKYEFSPISAIIQQKQKALVPFLTRLGGIVGGIFSTSGLLSLIVTESFDWLCCCWSTKQTKPPKL